MPRSIVQQSIGRRLSRRWSLLASARAGGWAVLGMVLVLVLTNAHAQQDYGNRLGTNEGDRVSYYATGPGMQQAAFAPALKRWYLPQEVANEYRWQWEYTNYARTAYRPYLSPQQEGDYFYDQYGRYLTKGWLVYDWRQRQPTTSQGSGILKPSGRYDSWFNSLLISTDSKGQHYLGVTIGDLINTTLTPMTFRKTRFNGVQFDYAADRLQGTVLLSRISLPVHQIAPGIRVPVFTENFTNLLGFRGVWQLHDAVQLGATFVNAHNDRSQSDRGGNPFKGKLTNGQLEDRINWIIVRISDDSPGDGEGGPTVFASDIEIRTKIGDRDTVLVGSEVGLQPQVEGGIIRNGFPVAEGAGGEGEITYRYNFSSEDEEVTALEDIIQDVDLVNNISAVKFRFLLNNDYRVDITSDVQTDNEPLGAQAKFLNVARAEDNVKDNSNQKWVVFDYGLPTATQVFGLSLEVTDWAGFRMYAEYNINHQFRQYPNIGRKTHHSTSGILGQRAATGWMVNIGRDFYPFFLFGEAFGMDAEYNTTSFIVDQGGRISYSGDEEARSEFIYDMVDDNDDNDIRLDQRRDKEGLADPAVFPGLDENNDFISDFNQNNTSVRPNFTPDYEEQFLRHYVDRPEFVFAVDLNNNGWGERFENDDEPDYPYKRDRRGYNAYLGAWLTPELKWMAGQERVRQLSNGDENLTRYSLLAYQRNFAGKGNAAFYHMFKLVQDDIADDLVQWVQALPELGRPLDRTGSMRPITDPLAMRDALVSRLWFGFESKTFNGVNTESKFIHEFIRQRDKDARDRDGRKIDRTTRRLGLINRIDYRFPLGRTVVQPRFKHELFMDDTPYTAGRFLGNPAAERQDWSGILSLLLQRPFLNRVNLQFGIERLVFRDFIQDEVAASEKPSGLLVGDTTGDYDETSVALQMSISTPYLGYDLKTLVGMRVGRRHLELFEQKSQRQTSAVSFVTVYGSLR
ncbi:MAG: hypothetical protein GKR89_11810 [Candidatus Latescibacteria bacterium]|nr:hypothetical protein [Candidatus Latescibacterota bacterium]